MTSARCWTTARPLLAAAATLALLAGCAPVQPWERGRLAQPHMALDPDALASAMDDHTYTSKEAASGGVGPAGGGCGCN